MTGLRNHMSHVPVSEVESLANNFPYPSPSSARPGDRSSLAISDSVNIGRQRHTPTTPHPLASAQQSPQHIQRRVNPSNENVRPSAIPSAQNPQEPSGSVSTDIGTVVYVETNGVQERHYRCCASGCANTTFGRVQELTRHYRTFHGGSIFSCPWCEHSMARKYRLNEHCIKVHDQSYTE
jgi:hypothetical protein